MHRPSLTLVTQQPDFMLSVILPELRWKKNLRNIVLLTSAFLLPAILWIRMAEARYQDGDEDCPNVSTTGRRDSTGKTILIAKFKLYSGDLKHVSDRFQDLLCVLYSITHEDTFGDFLMWRCLKKTFHRWIKRNNAVCLIVITFSLNINEKVKHLA